MKNRIKRTLLCLTAAAMVTTGGTIHADSSPQGLFAASGTADEPGEAENTVREKRSEAVEDTDFDTALVKKYMTLAGSDEGIDFYCRPKDFEDRIWLSFGFTEKPDGKTELTDAQKQKKESAEETISLLRKTGEAAALWTDSGSPAAGFKELSSGDGERLYISGKGRFLVTVGDDGKLKRVRKIISTLDSPNAFLTDDGKTLDLMEENNKKLDTTFTYKRTENGIMVYENADSGEFAWVTEDGSHYLGAFSNGAENDKLRMIVDRRNASFGIENKENGYIWWSSPLDAAQDSSATDLLADELRSSSALNYGIPERRNNNNLLRSHYASDCTTTVSDIENGIRVVYNYSKAGFRYPVEYTLEDDHLKASLKVSEIEETDPRNIATQVTLLGSFGAAGPDEEGYFVIPDGSGALVRFNNGKNVGSNAYLQRVYGRDTTVVPTSKGAVTEQIYLPVYGIVKEDNAMLVVASKGDSNALLSAKVSGQSNTSYNLCNFTFILRGTDTFYMSGSNEELTMFQSGDIDSDDIELLCYPIAKKDADYTDVAARYREYLLSEREVKVRAEEEQAALYVDLFGGVLKKQSVLGIPITMKTPVTRYSDAVDILTRLSSSGVDDMVVSYANWTSNGISNKVDTKAKPAFVLGGKKDFSSFTDFIDDNGLELYPISDNRDFLSGNGYYSFTNTSVRISGSYSRIVSYDRAYGIPDGFRKNMSLLSPDYFSRVFGKVADSYESAGLDGVCVADLTTSLYGDYGKKRISRYDAMNELIDCYKELSGSLDNGLLASRANAYALPYVKHIKDMPLSSSRFDIFDEDIPFCQMVLHGIIPYSTEAVNGSADPADVLLMAAATGSSLSFDLLSENPAELKDTEFDIYYYASSESWTDTAAAMYKLIKPILSGTSTSTITGYERDGDLITTTYSNGSVVRVDLRKKTIDFNGTLTDLEQFAKEGGIRF